VRRRGGSGLALLAFGSMVAPAADIADALDATLVNMRFVKPLDEELVRSLAASEDAIVTLEENAVAGGAGSAVVECLHRTGSTVAVLQLGVPDGFVEHGSREDNLAAAGLDAASLRVAIEQFWRGRGVARARPAG
jgi:1-deoxy-D-xylulose-5-phosphate synthase